MARKISSQQTGRAKRFALRFPVYFRELDSSTWVQGTTENISYSGVLFQSPSPLAVQSTVELRLQIAAVPAKKEPAEIRGKGVVVRMEKRDVSEIPIALAVAMRDCRIVRRSPISGTPVGNA